MKSLVMKIKSEIMMPAHQVQQINFHSNFMMKTQKLIKLFEEAELLQMILEILKVSLIWVISNNKVQKVQKAKIFL